MSIAKSLRWDWIVVIGGIVCLAVLTFAGPVGVALALLGAYSLGRWDESYGAKYR